MNGAEAVYRFDDVRVDTAAARVFKGEAPVALEPRAFELLCFLLRNQGRLVEKQELMESVWADAVVTENAVSRAVAHLRRALGDDAREARYLETVPTRGYRFVARVDSRPEPAPAEHARPRERRAWRPGAGAGWLAAGVLAGAAATWALRPSPPARPLQPRRLSVNLAPERLIAGHLDTLALSPDGRTIAFVGVGAAGDDESAVFLHDMQEGLTHRVSGSEDARGVFLSPDGRELGFLAQRTLHRVRVDGGPPSPVAGPFERSPRGASFGPDGSVFTTRDTGVVRIGADGTATPVAQPDPEKGEIAVVLPRAVPGRDALVVTVVTGDAAGDSRIDLVDLATGARGPLLPTGFDARPTREHVLFTWNGALLGARVDWKSARVLGDPFTVLEGVLSDGGRGVALYAASDSTLVYLPRAGDPKWQLLWVDRSGNERLALDTSNWVCDPAVAPDGSRFAFRSMKSRDGGIWIYEREGRGLRRVETRGRAASLVWAPSGERLAYGVRGYESGAGYDVFWQGLDPGDAAEPLAESPPWEFPKSFFPDGRRLVYEVEREWHNRDIWVVDAGEGGRAEPLIDGPSDEREPIVSPDGRWIAFQSDRTGRYEIYVVDASEPTRLWRVSDDGGREPLWTRGGRELVYRHGARIRRLDVDSGDEPRFGPPSVLFEEPLLQPGPGYRNFSVLPDGSEFLIVGAEGIPPPDVIEVVLDWPGVRGD